MVDGTAWRGAEYSAKLAVACAQGLNNAAEYLGGVSLSRTPIDVGTLRASETVVPATPSDLMSAVSFDTPYAVRQHEELSYKHPVGEAKFLERPLVEQSATLFQIIGAPIARIR